jgi:hypothetical protein
MRKVQAAEVEAKERAEVKAAERQEKKRALLESFQKQKQVASGVCARSGWGPARGEWWCVVVRGGAWWCVVVRGGAWCVVRGVAW